MQTLTQENAGLDDIKRMMFNGPEVQAANRAERNRLANAYWPLYEEMQKAKDALERLERTTPPASVKDKRAFFESRRLAWLEHEWAFEQWEKAKPVALRDCWAFAKGLDELQPCLEKLKDDFHAWGDVWPSLRRVNDKAMSQLREACLYPLLPQGLAKWNAWLDGEFAKTLELVEEHGGEKKRKELMGVRDHIIGHLNAGSNPGIAQGKL